MSGNDTLVAELEEAARGLAYNSIQNGCVDCGLAINLATRAADHITKLEAQVVKMREALEPFAAMGRVMERRATLAFGKMPADSEIVCESSGEAGVGILTMGHFRDAAALLPKAPGWGGVYRPPFDRAALKENGQ